MLARALICSFAAAILSAQTPPATLTYSGKPLALPFECEEERFNDVGIVCLEDQPCVVYTEMTAVHADASRILLAGNFHTQSATLASLVLMSEDGGATWTEPYTRVRLGSLEQIHFNGESGWISGQIIQSLARDPFFLVTKDSGKTWRRRSIYSEPTIGTIQGFRFEGPLNGEAVLLSEGRSQRWLTRNGGDTWQMSESTERKLPAAAAPAPDSTWRLRSDAKLKAHVLEHQQQGAWFTPVASFLIEAARCSPMP